MIYELLNEKKIIFNLKGSYDKAIRSLLELSDAENKNEMNFELTQKKMNRFSYLGLDVAIPHIRTNGLKDAEVILGISRDGIEIENRKVHVIFLLATPLADTSRYIKLLQGVSSFLSLIAKDLLESKTAEDIFRVIKNNEESKKNPSFKNLTQEQIAFELQTDLLNGLSNSEAESRLKFYGINALKKVRKISIFVKLFKNFFSLFAVLLWLASLLCFIPGVDMPQLGFAILIVVIVNGIFSFMQEYKSDKAVEALQSLISKTSKVVREGNLIEVNTSKVVPGDIIFLEEGDVVSADARLIEAFEIEVDNSALTGESSSVKRYKTDKPDLLKGKFLWIELPNIIFAGSSIIRGQAKAVVFGTGMNSEIGKIASMTQAIETEESPLQKQLKGTVFAISTLAFSLGIGFLLLGWSIAGLSFIQAFVFFIGLFVANVPEGLLPTVTLSLAMGVSRMAKRNAVVKNLSSVETLGCTTVICCDKTGTLTQNLMMVTKIYSDDKIIDVTGIGYEPAGNFFIGEKEISPEELSTIKALPRLLECAFSCNNARLEKTPAGHHVIGDPTEGALVTLAKKAKISGVHQRIFHNPFESLRKRMSVIVKEKNHERKIAYVKGGTLEILSKSSKIFSEGVVKNLEEASIGKIKSSMDSFAAEGLRVLALAYREDDELQSLTEYSVENVEKELIFLGLVAMSDPVRPTVPAAIESCHKAGIRVIMITGDYALTAASIGKQIGLGAKDNLRLIAGSDLISLNDNALRDILLEGEAIFSRVSPEQKLRIVTILKDLGEIVAVTGDGVNDGPALKKADIGIAMGMRGTDVAKEAAEIILVDDNFSSIVAAIEEGRSIFENIKKFASYVLSSNPQEMYPYIFWMLFPEIPLAMTVMGVLAVDVGTDLIPAMGLGIEPPEKGIMEKPPRQKSEKLMSVGFIFRHYFVQGTILAIACYATYYYFTWTEGFWENGFSLFKAPASPKGLDMNLATPQYLQSLTAYFFPTVTTQIGNVMCRRSSTTSLFSRDFLNQKRREDILLSIRNWKPQEFQWKINYQLDFLKLSIFDSSKFFFTLLLETIFFPFKLFYLMVNRINLKLEKRIFRPFLVLLSKFLKKFYILLNLFSNPLINMGIAFELFLCFLFFYTDLSKLYFFQPVPWHVYLFALNGTILIITFEEIKKYFRRKGHPLEFLG